MTRGGVGRRRAGALLVGAAAAAALSGCGVLGSAPSPTSTYAGADGETVTVDWADYPGEAGVDADAVRAAPDQDELEPVARELIERVRAAIEAEGSVVMAPVEREGTWFDDDNWFAADGNGYGGESMYVTLNCCDLESESVPAPDAWRGVLDAASAVTEEFGLGPLVLDNESDAMTADADWAADYAEQYCNLPGGGCWAWYATAYGDSQWISLAIRDSSRDPSGDALAEAEQFDWPVASVSLSYGATVIRAGMREAFDAALAPFEGLEQPAPTTSD